MTDRRQISPEHEARLRAALKAGRKDEARQIFREATGASERMARFAIFLMVSFGLPNRSKPPSEPPADIPRRSADPIEPPPPRPSPQPRHSAVEATSGCGGMILLVLGPLVLAAWLLAWP